VRLAAQLTGHPLDVLNTNSAMDTTELLGGFEQVRLHSLQIKMDSFFSLYSFLSLFLFPLLSLMVVVGAVVTRAQPLY
jgi:hypothetical protein